MAETMTRREWIRTTTAASVAALCSGAAAAPERGKPDLLLIMPDQMRGDCLSALGHPVVRTPTLDALARDGALFRRAYTTVASCIPARYALLTGLFPQTSGAVGFRAKPITTGTLPGTLGQAGYESILIGRNMHQLPASGSCGYARRTLGSTYVDGDDYDIFLKAAAPDSGGIRKLVTDLGVTYNHWQAKPWPLADELHPTAWVVAEARRTLRDRNGEQPLFLTVSFYAPHPPLFPPALFFDECAARPLPDPAFGDWVDRKTLTPEGADGGHRVLLEGPTLRSAQAGYFGLISHLDAQLAPLVREFRERAVAAGRPWAIVVTSDHGEMLGDHGFFRKCEPYEGSANIPFIVAGSAEFGLPGGIRSNRPVCLEDIMPTLLSLAEVPLPNPVDGVDLTPVLRGTAHPVREQLHFEHAPCYSQAQAYHALTDGRFKYIWRPKDGSEQLFDLDADPGENRNLAVDPNAAEGLRTWRSAMVLRLAKRPEGFSDGTRLIAGRPYRPLNPGTPPNP